MAKVAAPKSADYDIRVVRAQKIAALKTQKGKPNRTPAEINTLLDQLIDLVTTTP